MQRYQYYEYLTSKLFAYFNGKINIFNNKAVLNIDWTRGSDLFAGKATAPNVVTIRPFIIEDNSTSMDDFMFLLTEVIIHELFHTDQFCYCISPSAEYTKTMTEDPVEAMTALYMINNARKIEAETNIPIAAYNLESYFSNVDYVAINRYYRLTYLLQIVKLMSNIPTDGFKEFKQFVLCTKNATVMININNTFIFTVLNKGIANSLDALNQFMYDHIYKYNHFYCAVLYRYYDNNTCVVNIIGKFYDELCKIIKE